MDDTLKTVEATETAKERVMRYLEQKSFVDANADDTLSDEDKENAITYESLTEEEKEALDEILKDQISKSKVKNPNLYFGAKRKPLTASQLKVRKKKKKISNASRKANQKKARKR